MPIHFCDLLMPGRRSLCRMLAWTPVLYLLAYWVRKARREEPSKQSNEDDDDRAIGFQMQEASIRTQRGSNPVVYLDISIGGEAARLTFELRKDIVPRTAENFRSLCVGDRNTLPDGTRLSYQGCIFHRVVKDFAVVGGDIAHHDGTGRVSVYGAPFADENFMLRHTGPGVLTCCNAGPDTNTSTFMITTVEAPWLDGRCVVFGYLTDSDSFEALDKMESYGSEHGRPSVLIQITACGQLFPPIPKPRSGALLGASRSKAARKGN